MSRGCLSAKEVKAIVKAYRAGLKLPRGERGEHGLSQNAIAERYGVSGPVISRIWARYQNATVFEEYYLYPMQRAGKQRLGEQDSPLCRCGTVLAFETDWLGRLLEWCPRCGTAPSTCHPNRAA